jgi:hypothetical protein
MPRSKMEIDSQIFSFCLTDKILGNSARFDGSLSKPERKYSAGVATVTLLLTLSCEGGHDSGFQKCIVVHLPLRDETTEWKRALPSSLPVHVARHILST